MSKVVTIHQPDFIPYLGFFDRWKKSDVFIILDDVQFIRRGWHHRDKIKTANGEIWLTIPVVKKGKYDQLINEVHIDATTDWKKSHLKTIELSYKKSVNFKWFFPILQKIYSEEHTLLMDFNMRFLAEISALLGISTPFVLASRYNITTTKTDRLISLIKAVNGTDYLTGSGSRDYLEEDRFKKEGLSVTWQNFEHPVYDQQFTGFIPNLSIIDYIFNAKQMERK